MGRSSVRSKRRIPTLVRTIPRKTVGGSILTSASSASQATNLTASLHDTCSELHASLRYNGRLEVLRTAADHCLLHSDKAILVQLIVSEAVTNAISYAHPTGIAGRIAVTCSPVSEAAVTIEVTDDGVGLPEGFDPATDGGTGFRVMRALSQRLGAALAFESTSLGLRVSLRVPVDAGQVTDANAGGGPVDDGLRTSSKANGSDPRIDALLVDVSAHKRAELLLAQQLGSLAALYQFTDRLFRAESLEDVFDAALHAIGRALGCQRASILLLDDFGIMKFAAWRGLSDAYRQAVEGHSPWGRDVKDPQPLCVENVETADFPESLKSTVRAEGIGALAFIPLAANGGLVGKFMTYYEAPHAFTAAEVDLAVTIARQLGFSLERRHAEAELRKTQRQLVSELAAAQRLQQVSTQLIQESDAEALYGQVLDAAVAIMASDMASMQRVDESQNALRLLAWRGFERQFGKVFELCGPDTRTSCSVAMRIGQRVVVPDVETCEFIVGAQALHDHRKNGIRAVQSTPLISRTGAMLGMISTHWRRPHQPSERDLRLLDVLARQAADLIERKQAEHNAQRLVAIVDSSHDAIVSKDLNGVITTWNRGAEQLFGYTADEMIGKPITTLIPPDRHNEEVSILECIRRGEPVDHYETVRQRKDGSLVDISLTVSPLKDAAGKVVGASKIARDITEKKQAQARQELLTREIQHRTKNLFAVVLAVVSRSFVGKYTVKDAEAAVVSRLRSLGQTHVMLIEKEWQGADLAEIVRAEIGPYAGRVKVEGPSLMLTARAAQNFALALHELATNAAKYGALSNATGRVLIFWSKHASNGSNDFTFRWQEQGGPPVWTPTEKGFGSAVLEQVMAEHFEVPPQVQFAPAGVIYELNGSLGTLVQTNEYCSAEDTHEPA